MSRDGEKPGHEPGDGSERHGSALTENKKNPQAEGAEARREHGNEPAAELSDGSGKKPDKELTEAERKEKAEEDKVLRELADLEKEAMQLPDNQYKDVVLYYIHELKTDATKRGGFSMLFISIYAFYAKFSHYSSMAPGKYSEYLGTDSKISEEKLSEKKEDGADGQLEKIMQAKKGQINYPNAEKKAKYKEVGKGAASAKYAAYTLWGFDDIDGTDQLAARLKNTRKIDQKDNSEISYFNEVSLSDLQKDGAPYGTILIFIPELTKAQRITAFATGNGDEFQYYNCEEDKEVIFHLRDKDSPLKLPFAFQLALRPNFNSDEEYFAKSEHKDQMNQKADDTLKGKSKQAILAVEGARRDLMSSEQGGRNLLAALESAPTAVVAESVEMWIDEVFFDLDALINDNLEILKNPIFDSLKREEKSEIMETLRSCLTQRIKLIVDAIKPITANRDKPAINTQNKAVFERILDKLTKKKSVLEKELEKFKNDHPQ